MPMRRFTPEETGLELVDHYEPVPWPPQKRIIPPPSTTVEEMVTVFHSVADIVVGETEAFKNKKRTNLRWDLIEEEWDELRLAWKEYEDPVDTLDAICDLAYVLIGAAVEFGWSFDEAFKRVHESNMSKLIGRIKERRDGKILKGKHFVPPDLEDLV
jgi:predicted HAD superfamily Cof-like phosphohydrolase